MVCVPGHTRPCYPDADSTPGTGECQHGTQRCTDVGQWGSCDNPQLPTAEICDGKDNDCDGQIDEGCDRSTFCKRQQLNDLVSAQALYFSTSPKRVVIVLSLAQAARWEQATMPVLQPSSWRLVSSTLAPPEAPTRLELLVETDAWSPTIKLSLQLSLRFPGARNWRCDFAWSSPRLTPGCLEGRSPCEHRCVSLSTDATHCGQCGRSCRSSQRCEAGTCQDLPCPSGQSRCSDGCFDLENDANHCGRCGQACASNLLCYQGKCTDPVDVCKPPLAICGQDCADLKQDLRHCGKCFASCSSQCKEGVCTDRTPTCQPHQTLCKDTCVDLKSAQNHCGTCGNICGPGKVCDNGSCVPCQDCVSWSATFGLQLEQIGLDATGNTYAAGTLYRNATVGTKRLAPVGKNELIVLKLAPNGNVLWVLTAPAVDQNGDVELGDIHVTTQGEVYLTGTYHSSISFGSTIHRSQGRSDIFWARISSNGTWSWSKSWGGPENDVGLQVHADTRASTQPAIYLTVATRGDVTIEGIKLSHVGNQSQPNHRLFRLTATGGITWHYQYPSDRVHSTDGLGIDSTGHIYVASTFTGGLQIGTTQIVPSAGSQALLVRFSPSGTPLWAQQVRGYHSVSAKALAIDSQDRITMAGMFSSPIQMGGAIHAPQGSYDLFVGRWDKSGKLLWSASGGGTFSDAPVALAVDAQGKSYLLAESRPDARLGEIWLFDNQQPLRYVGQLDDKGQWVGAQRLLTGDLRKYDMAMDASGALYTTGTFSSAHVQIRQTQLPRVANSISGFIAKYTPPKLMCPTDHMRCSGVCVQPQQSLRHCGACGVSCQAGERCNRGSCVPCHDCISWLATGVTSGNPSGTIDVRDIAKDSKDNIYVVGLFSRSATFGSKPISTAGSYGAYIAKLAPSGQWLWAKALDSRLADTAYSVAVDPSDNVYWAGTYGAATSLDGISLPAPTSTAFGLFVSKLSPAGATSWVTTASPHQQNQGISLTAHSSGVFITGQYGKGATFGALKPTLSTVADAFVAKLDLAGTWRWVTGLGSTHPSQGHQVQVDSNGHVYWAGYFKGNISFGTSQVTNHFGNVDAFVAKVDSSGKPQWLRRAGSPTADDRAYGMVVDQRGVFLAGKFGDVADFGTHKLTSQGKEDLFVARLDLQGSWQWARSYGTSSRELGYSLARTPKGDLIVAGNYYDAFDLGAFKFTTNNASSPSVFVLRLDDKGQLLGGAFGGNIGNDDCQAGALTDRAGNIIMAVTTDSRSFRMGQDLTPFIVEGPKTAFVAKLTTATPCPRTDSDLCGGVCVNLQSSTSHCGRCTNACSSGQQCVQGTCQ